MFGQKRISMMVWATSASIGFGLSAASAAPMSITSLRPIDEARHFVDPASLPPTTHGDTVAAEPAKDVLLVSVRGRSETRADGSKVILDTTDYARYWTSALDEAEISHDEWSVESRDHRGVPPLATLQRYRLVIVAGGDSNLPIEAMPDDERAMMTSLHMYLLGGGRLLASGSHWPVGADASGGAQPVGSAHLLPRYFAGWDLVGDDVPLPRELVPTRLFDKPLRLGDISGRTAANNAQTIDLGRSLRAVDRRPRAADAQLVSPFIPAAFEQVKPFVKSYIETADGKCAMTGVTADATLEQPGGDPRITWRALFAGFPIEAVNGVGFHLSRAELLQRVFAWATAPTTLTLHVRGDDLESNREGMLTAEADLPTASRAIGWRWDAGDGRAFERTSTGKLRLIYGEAGTYHVQVEVSTDVGHTFVGAADIEVKDSLPSSTRTPARPPAVFLPLALQAWPRQRPDSDTSRQ